MNTAISSTQNTVEYKRIQIDGVYYYGKHLVLTGTGCNERILEESAIAEFLTSLVKKIDMVAYGNPLVARFGSGIEEGISAVQLIETSAITVHTNDMARDFYLDVFSCKGYSELDVLECLEQSFHPSSTNYQILLRK